MSENCKIWEGNIATIETREKICFRSSMFNKKDGKVQNYYYTLNQGTFVILLPNVIFFLIFPPNLEGTKSLWIGVKTHPYLSFFFLFFLFTFFSRIILWKTNLLYFFFLFFFLSSIFSYQPNAPFCFTNTFVLVFLFLFFTSCVFNDVKTKYLVYLLFPTFLLNTYNLL